MTNLYEQHLLEIQVQALDDEMKLKERKFYNRIDIENLKTRGWYLFCAGFVAGLVIALIMIRLLN